MDVIILMSWGIWNFNNVDPSVDNCPRKFSKEMAMLMHRDKEKHKAKLQEWIDHLA